MGSGQNRQPEIRSLKSDVKIYSSKWFWLGAFFLICTITVLTWMVCDYREQKQAEARIHRYFTLDSMAQLTSTNITRVLESRFPSGTPVKAVGFWLGKQGLGTDGHSTTWETKQMVSYQIDDYEDSFFTILNRHIEVSILFDDQGKVQSFEANSYTYSL